MFDIDNATLAGDADMFLGQARRDPRTGKFMPPRGRRATPAQRRAGRAAPAKPRRPAGRARATRGAAATAIKSIRQARSITGCKRAGGVPVVAKTAAGARQFGVRRGAFVTCRRQPGVNVQFARRGPVGCAGADLGTNDMDLADILGVEEAEAMAHEIGLGANELTELGDDGPLAIIDGHEVVPVEFLGAEELTELGASELTELGDEAVLGRQDTRSGAAARARGRRAAQGRRRDRFGRFLSGGSGGRALTVSGGRRSSAARGVASMRGRDSLGRFLPEGGRSLRGNAYLGQLPFGLSVQESRTTMLAGAIIGQVGGGIARRTLPNILPGALGTIVPIGIGVFGVGAVLLARSAFVTGLGFGLLPTAVELALDALGIGKPAAPPAPPLEEQEFQGTLGQPEEEPDLLQGGLGQEDPDGAGEAGLEELATVELAPLGQELTDDETRFLSGGLGQDPGFEEVEGLQGELGQDDPESVLDGELGQDDVVSEFEEGDRELSTEQGMAGGVRVNGSLGLDRSGALAPKAETIGSSTGIGVMEALRTA